MAACGVAVSVVGDGRQCGWVGGRREEEVEVARLYDLDVVYECSKTAEFILPTVASSSVVSALSMLPLPSF